MVRVSHSIALVGRSTAFVSRSIALVGRPIACKGAVIAHINNVRAYIILLYMQTWGVFASTTLGMGLSVPGNTCFLEQCDVLVPAGVCFFVLLAGSRCVYYDPCR